MPGWLPPGRSRAGLGTLGCGHWGLGLEPGREGAGSAGSEGLRRGKMALFSFPLEDSVLESSEKKRRFICLCCELSCCGKLLDFLF